MMTDDRLAVMPGDAPAHHGWHDIVSGHARGVGPSLARAGLRAASGLYAAGLAANHLIYDWGLKARTRPALPTVSVGNLTLGGTGKTTTAAYLARRLVDRVKPVIILRGYGRHSTEDSLIVADGARILAGLGDAGDEALMLARSLPGCAVAVGKRRERVIRDAAAATGAQVAILDDGLQYFRMERAADIVLLDALADLATWRLFPAGVLREPLRQLRQATQVWITHCDLAGEERVARLQGLVSAQGFRGSVVTTRHRSGGLRPLVPGRTPPGGLAGRTVVALSALGNPDAFECALEGLGARVVRLRFADHHAYTVADYAAISQLAEEAGAELVVTTEKDAVKLPPPPGDCPQIAVLGCDLDILSGEDAVEELLSRVAALVR